MKTIVIEPSSPVSWYFIPDSALVNSGKPFFIPEFSDEFEAFLSPVVRISRIGKSIGSRFAHRYYTEIAPGVHFRASKLRRELLAARIPADPSHSFDRSMTVGEFIPLDSIDKGTAITMLKNNVVAAECDIEKWKGEIGNLLENVSRSNTVKMGDYIVPQLIGPTKVDIGDHLKINLGTTPMFFIDIK